MKAAVTRDVTLMPLLPGRMACDERALHSAIFFPKTHNSNLIVRKTSDKPRLGDILQGTWPTVLQTVSLRKQTDTVTVQRRWET